MEGIGLLRSLIESTGLPIDAVEREIQRLLKAQGLVAEHLTIDDVRELLAAYLLEVLNEAKTELSP